MSRAVRSSSILACLILPILWWAGCGSPVSDGDAEALPELFEAPEFELLNSMGETVGSKDLEGQVWVVDFIFTRCGGPCPLMTQRMRGLQERLQEEGLLLPEAPVRLVSISVDPEYDRPEVLSDYADTWKADTRSWSFLTGDPDSTLRLIREGFKIAAEEESREGSGGMPDIVHSTNFLIVGPDGWVRKIVHLDDERFQETIVESIRNLLSEST